MKLLLLLLLFGRPQGVPFVSLRKVGFLWCWLLFACLPVCAGRPNRYFLQLVCVMVCVLCVCA